MKKARQEDRGGSQRDIYPIENFFSALTIVWRRIFSAFGVNVEACINVMPYGFGVVGADGRAGEASGGVAVRSAGEVGRPGQFVLESDVVDGEADVAELVSDTDELLLGDRVKDEPPNNDFAGDDVMEWFGELGCLGDACGDWDCGICTSFRTTMRERWSRFRARRVET